MARHDHTREDLTEEHPANHPGQILGALLFFIVSVTDKLFLKLTIIPFAKPYIQIPLAILIAGIAVYMISTGLRIVFGERRDPPEVIRKGVFGLIRHPVYSGAMLIMLAFFILGLSLMSLAVIAVNFIFYNLMASYEERQLIELFGRDYEEYMKDVGKWLPRLRRRLH